MTSTSAPPLRRQLSLRDRSEAATEAYHTARTACIAAANARVFVANEIARHEAPLIHLHARELSGERGAVLDEIAEHTTALENLRAQLAEREAAVTAAERVLSTALREAERAQALADLARIARSGQTVLDRFMPALASAGREILATADRLAASMERLAEVRATFLEAAKTVAPAIMAPPASWTPDEREAVAMLLAELEGDRINLAAVREHWTPTTSTGIDEPIPYVGEAAEKATLFFALGIATHLRAERVTAQTMESVSERSG